MIKIIVAITVMSLAACAGTPRSIDYSSSKATVERFTGWQKMKDRQKITVVGYYWPSYEGSVICQTKKYENCLIVVLTEQAYQRYLGKFDIEDPLVRLSGNFQWIDIEANKRHFLESDEILPLAVHHRLTEVKKIKLVKSN